MTAPDQTAVTGAHNLFHLFDAEIDARQHLHGVGGPRWRRDGARGCFRNGQAVRRDDRHDDHGCPVAWNSPDAVLVDHDRLVPGEFRAGLGHGIGQRQQLTAGQKARGANQERRGFHVGIAIVNKVVDDGADLVGGQSAALNFGSNGIDTGRRRRRRHRNLAASGFAESTECRFRQAEVLGADQTVIVGDDQGGEQRFRIVTHLDPAEAPKYFRPQGLRAPRHDGDVFPSGVEIDPADIQLLARWVGGAHSRQRQNRRGPEFESSRFF